MQPLRSLHVLLLSQGQNWIAPGDCIFPYAWHFSYIIFIFPFALKYSCLIEKNSYIFSQLLCPYLTYFSNIHNYSVGHLSSGHSYHWFAVTPVVSLWLCGGITVVWFFPEAWWSFFYVLSRTQMQLHPISEYLRNSKTYSKSISTSLSWAKFVGQAWIHKP